MELDRLTHSCASCARRCLRMFYYRFILGISKLKSGGALRIGGAVHKGWELWRKGMDADKAILAAVESYDIIPEWADAYEWECERSVVVGLLRAYVSHYAGDTLEWVAVEVPFLLPLINPETGGASKTFKKAGKIDGIVKLNGQLVLLEGKTTADSVDSGSDYWQRLRVDPQPSQYVLAARELGYDVQACLYDVIHKPGIRPSNIALLDEDGRKVVLNAAGERVMTKDGKKPRETGDTSLGYVLQTRPETPKEFEDRIFADCQERPEFYFARREIPRLEDDLNEFREELWQIGQLILTCRSRGIWFRNVGKATCTGCEYADLCLNCVRVTPNEIPPGFQKLGSLYPELEEAQS